MDLAKSVHRYINVARRHKNGLVWVGIFTTILGFYVDKAASFPSVLAVLSPTYARAIRALDTLEERRVLAQTDDDFAALASYLVMDLNDASGRHPSVDVLSRFELESPQIAFGDRRAGERIPFNMHVKGQEKPIRGEFRTIREAIEKKGNSSLLWWSLGFFWLGIAITAAGAVMDAAETTASAS